MANQWLNERAYLACVHLRNLPFQLSVRGFFLSVSAPHSSFSSILIDLITQHLFSLPLIYDYVSFTSRVPVELLNKPRDPSFGLDSGPKLGTAEQFQFTSPSALSTG